MAWCAEQALLTDRHVSLGLNEQSGVYIKHLVTMPHIGQLALRIYVPWKYFYMPSQYQAM